MNFDSHSSSMRKSMGSPYQVCAAVFVMASASLCQFKTCFLFNQFL